MTYPLNKLNIAVLIPCHNEEKTIGLVVDRFKKCLPEAKIYVYDNLSNDNTILVAKKKNVQIGNETWKGKGNVVRRMFSDIDADIFIMTDGDNTYEVEKSLEMIDLLLKENLDMVVGKRVHNRNKKAYPVGHVFGNMLITKTVTILFGRGYTDMLSGFRVFSRRFVKSFPIKSEGFEIETEITVHSLLLKIPTAEVETVYTERPSGSESKLNTISDGFKILLTIFSLVKEIKPFKFFGLIAILLFIIAIVISLPIIEEYYITGLVPRLPTAILSASLMILSFMSFVAGTILDSVSKSALELKRLHYLER